MEQSRRTFLQYSAAAVASTGTAASRNMHLVLLGDSIFDNGAYTGGKPDVITQLRNVIPRGWKADLLARDGATTEGIAAQLARVPPGATHLVLSVGGNDALMQQHLLRSSASSTAEALTVLGHAVRHFETAYRKVIDACVARGLPLTICTIYNGNFDDRQYQRIVQVALALFNDAIIRTATEHHLNVIELRMVCSQPEDYANAIEPSSTGAAKIARAILIATKSTSSQNTSGISAVRAARLFSGRG
ncbi:SGNH/GDSL hydrolase family protein [Noviherbaspirillum sp. Root189]|uniref:SGNH/GDSL hydrolase family protein n=1 Tax=Noviherbaspirillum sp. Root189 TaxID=1736487 RepID=UPI000A6C169D|nr:SGNH/GDSL hydrolase family protein [Noviherbaspirillum sp. Root189]